mmetsp:Transcript_13890/g.28418  ORF Transcript_13890/g.28418 Transcript_13890/m.28418 type:complete len:195 (+) Transcript_13890:271-855(+)
MQGSDIKVSVIGHSNSEGGAVMARTASSKAEGGGIEGLAGGTWMSPVVGGGGGNDDDDDDGNDEGWAALKRSFSSSSTPPSSIGFVRSQSAAAFVSPLCLLSASFALPIPQPVNEQSRASFFAISFFSTGEGSEEEDDGAAGESVEGLRVFAGSFSVGAAGGAGGEGSEAAGGRVGEDMESLEAAVGLQSDSSI